MKSTRPFSHLTGLSLLALLATGTSVYVPDVEDLNSGRPELKGEKGANASRDSPTRKTVDRLKCLS
jgi:hypothetical protein